MALRPADCLQNFSDPEIADDVHCIYPLTDIGLTVLRVMDQVRLDMIAERSGRYPIELAEDLDRRIIGNLATMTKHDFKQTLEPYICPQMPPLLAGKPSMVPCKELGVN